MYVEAGWILAMPDPNPHIGEHTHDYDEIVIHLGVDSDNPGGAGRRNRVRVDRRPLIVEKTSAVFVPKGVKHGPLDLEAFP